VAHLKRMRPRARARRRRADQDGCARAQRARREVQPVTANRAGARRL